MLALTSNQGLERQFNQVMDFIMGGARWERKCWQWVKLRKWQNLEASITLRPVALIDTHALVAVDISIIEQSYDGYEHDTYGHIADIAITTNIDGQLKVSPILCYPQLRPQWNQREYYQRAARVFFNQFWQGLQTGWFDYQQADPYAVINQVFDPPLLVGSNEQTTIANWKEHVSRDNWLIVDMWNDGDIASQIASSANLSEGRVRNIVTTERKKLIGLFGLEEALKIIPYRLKRRDIVI